MDAQDNKKKKEKSDSTVPIEAVEKWISEQGYSFEMEVQQKFQKAGFDAALSNHFVDFESNKSREIDIIANKTTLPGHKYMFRFSMCIECKYTKGRPWVIFSGESPFDCKFILNYAVRSEHFQILIDLFDKDEFLENDVISPLYLGHGIVQALKEKNHEDMAYTACMSAFKASLSEVEVLEKSKIIYNLHSLLSIPVVVLDGQLFDCHLDENSKTITSEIKYGAVQWKHHNPSNFEPIIYVVTKEGLDEFINSMNNLSSELIGIRKKYGDTLAEYATREVQEYFKKYRNNETTKNVGLNDQSLS